MTINTNQPIGDDMARGRTAADLSDPLAAWFGVGTAMFQAWLQWQGGVWRSYRDLQAEWMQLCQDRACDWALCLGTVRGGEQLA